MQLLRLGNCEGHLLSQFVVQRVLHRFVVGELGEFGCISRPGNPG